MNSQKGINKEDQNRKSDKMVWQLPELIELDINEATLNVTKVPGVSVNDGGNPFTDYNS
ncbi:hypothetical protein [Roseivirga sp. E12]|uniref:hypothetical protein n=1 Tax=Roseivirga sp. E12 TaxID=2819237 RepID=UPI001ABC68B8|nr:hypothetical protein [Roseivirga sp. E12]MBO3699059.1 hypothetical protein [Roseivirga sp. E12]